MMESGASSLIGMSAQATVGEMFSSVANAFPNRVALVDAGRSISYEELEKRSNRLSAELIVRGVKRGDRIGVLSRNRFEYFEILIAAAKTGAIVASLNWQLQPSELAHCVSLVEPKLVLVSENMRDAIKDEWQIDQIVLGSSYETCLAKHTGDFIAQRFDTEAGLVILYTSGTTGLPKGALISHRAMIARGTLYHMVLEVPDADNFIAWTPFYHMVSTDQGLATLLRGGTVWCLDGYQPERLIELVEQLPINWLVLVPGMVGSFNAELRKRPVKPKKLSLIGAMADLIPKDEIAEATRLLGAPFLNTFGSTETGIAPATGGRIAIGEAPKTLSKIQTPYCDLRLEDDKSIEVPVGVPGEAKVSGPTIFSGYWNNDAANCESFRGGRFCMGDVLRRNSDGTLDYVDRVKYMIKSGGENIYPAEIELVIADDSRVETVVVVRKPDDKWGEVPVAFIVKRSQELSEREIITLCKSHLASYKIPKQIVFVEGNEIPRSTTGKVQRHLLEGMLPAS